MPTTTLPPPGPGGPPASLAPAVPAAGTRPPPRPACGRPRSPRFDRGLRRRQARDRDAVGRSEEHTSELQSHSDLVCRLLLEKKNGSTYPRLLLRAFGVQP